MLADGSCGSAAASPHGLRQTETCAVESPVNGERRQSLQRASNVIPASSAMRSSSEGQTYRNAPATTFTRSPFTK